MNSGAPLALGRDASSGSARRASFARGARKLVRFMQRKPLGATGALVIVLLILCAVFAPLIVPHDPATILSAGRLQPPSSANLFGTDEKARDIFSQIIWGSRLSLEVGFLAVAAATALGTALALWSGYAGGWIDLLVQRGVDTMLALPPLVFALVIVAMLGPSVRNVIAGVALIQLPATVRVLRAAVLTVRDAAYVDAARAIGVPPGRILARHILPNVAPAALVILSTSVGAAILTETALSFLGYGASPSVPSWGRMLNSARPFIITQPWLGIFSGAAITLCVFSVNVAGDALRDVLDPRLRGAG
jgi:peptide/nickel transport system permease protein